MHDELLQHISEARAEVYRSVGEMDDMILSPLLNPSFMGGPRWPSLRQGWRVIRRQGNTLIASDGLSDPFDDQDEPSAGFGLEFILEALEDIPGSWPFGVVYAVSQLAAGHGGVRELIEELGFISTEVRVEGMPEALLSPQGRVGVLLGVPAETLPSSIPTPGGEVQLVAVKLLMPEELDYIVKHGERGRAEVVARLASSSGGHVSRLNRQSVV
jgi:Suppressor of fused protein (SUFU)